MSQEDLVNLINTYIIDNNENIITPKILRGVLKQIVLSIPSGSGTSLTANAPLNFDAFTSVLSLRPVGFGNFTIFKGDQAGEPNTSNVLEIGDVAMGVREVGIFYIGAYKGGDVNDFENNWSEILNSQYK